MTEMSARKGLPPVHCPASADAFAHLHGVEVDVMCAARGRRTRHRRLAQREEQVAQWLADLSEELQAGTVQQLRVTNPDPAKDDVLRHDLDPSTAHVLIGLARRGVNKAPAIYVSLVCQCVDTSWHGVTGAYLQICTCAEEADGRAAAQRLARVLPASASLVRLVDLPDGLKPRTGWWESRLRQAHQLFSHSGEWWSLKQLAALAIPSAEALLVRVGPRITAESNLLFVDDPQQLRSLSPLLAAVDAEPMAVVRAGPRSLLQRIGGWDGHGMPAALHSTTDRETAGVVGWAVVAVDDRAQLTRSGSRLARRLRAELTEDGADVQLWAAPRLSPTGAVDGPGLLRLLDEQTRR